MSFWSKFAKFGLPAIGLAAAPFTGGASLLTTLGMGAKTAGLIGAAAGVGSKLASGASAQRAQDRGAQTDLSLLNNQQANQHGMVSTGQHNSQALDYAKAKQAAELARIRQLGSVDMLSNLKPPSDPRAMKFASSAQMSPEHLALIRERAMKALETGSDVPEMREIPAFRETQMTPGTKTDSILNALSMGGTVLGGLREAGLFGGPQQPAAGGVDLGQISGVGQLHDYDKPWWLKQSPQTMDYKFGKVNL